MSTQPIVNNILVNVMLIFLKPVQSDHLFSHHHRAEKIHIDTFISTNQSIPCEVRCSGKSGTKSYIFDLQLKKRKKSSAAEERIRSFGFAQQ